MDKKYKKKGLSFDMGDGDNLSFTPKKIKPEQGELEVTGVSRSGRVRKKSSKLMDFESPEELERHPRGRKADKDQFGSPPHSMLSPKAKKHTLMKSGAMSDEEDPASMYPVKEEAPYSDESGPDIGLFQAGDSSLDSLGSEVDDEDLDDTGLDDVSGGATSGFQKVVQDPDSMPSSGTSLYMLEKSAKKNLIIRDGKIVGRTKTQRKDKGKTRFTAYMLWAKEIRKEIMAANPEMDFSTTSKKLGELWSTVPYNEKFLWKRRAKRAATKAQRGGGGAKRGGDTTGANKYINKQNVPQHALSIAETVLQLGQPTVMAAGGLAVSPPEHAISARGLKGGLVSEPVVGTGLYKVIGTAPIDLAAHLRLLGESLTIIGERLKEHKGQIAVSGSLSVLLDSLVCAIGPLTCLTQQVPELNVIPQEKLSKILDNIAYIMPGL